MLEEIVKKEISKLVKTNTTKNDFAIQLAYSGGLDSSCLLHVLIKLKKYFNFKLFVTYVNYSTSPYSLKVLKKINQISSDVIVSTIDAQINPSKNFESEARDIRYSFFYKINKKYNIDYIFTAHHYEDQIETLAMKFMDGDDLVGMQGIRKRTGVLFRPMLEVSKRYIVEYAKKNKICYFEDPTNQDISFRRNKVRKIIIPILMQDSFIFNKVKDINQKSILKFEKIKKEVHNVVNTLDFKECGDFKFISLNSNHINNKDAISVKLLFKSILKNHFNQKTYDRSKNFWIELSHFISNAKTGALFSFSGKISLLKDREDIILFDDTILKQKQISRVKIDRKIGTFLGNIEISQSKHLEVIGESEYALEKRRFEKGVFVRSWKKGDRVYFDYGSKKVSDLFIDFKLPIIKKKIYPIVEDFKGEIIWIPKIYSKKAEFSNNSVLLKWSN